MANHTRDNSICRACKLKEPDIIMPRHANGLPKGECLECRRIRDQSGRVRKHFYADLYDSTGKLTNANAKILMNVLDGVYPLIYKPTKLPRGYILIWDGVAVVSLWDLTERFRADTFGLATYLANQRVLVDPTPIPAESSPVENPETHCRDLPLLVVQDRLIMYDAKLREYAIRMVRDEITQAKQANVALARAAKAKR